MQIAESGSFSPSHDLAALRSATGRSSPESSPRVNPITAFLVAACIALMGVSLLLARENRSLKVDAERNTRLLQPRPGIHLPGLTGQTRDGKRFELAYGIDRRKTLLLSFSPTCGVCEENWQNWDKLLEQLNGDAMRIVGVDLNSSVTEEYAQRHRLNRIPMVSELSLETVLLYNLKLTPQTVLIDATGTVEKAWTGALDRRAMEEILQSINR